MKLCDTCIYRNENEYHKPCIVYRDDCTYYEKEREDMTREEAIKILRKEIECLSHTECSDCILEKVCKPTIPSNSEYIEVFGMAIKALEQNESAEEWYKLFVEKLEQEPCEVSEYDKDHIWYKGGQYISLRRFLEAKAEAEQEPSGDLISREDLEECKELMTDVNGDTVYAVRMSDIRQLPPVNPQEPKTGHWVRTTDEAEYLVWECDKCGWQQRYNTNFCPYCGARMESEEV